MRFSRTLLGSVSALALATLPAAAQYAPTPIDPVAGIYIPASSAADFSARINAGFASNGTVNLGCGIYNVTNSILTPSNSKLNGLGPCTIIQGTTDLLLNAHPSTGDSNITVSNLGLHFLPLSGNHKLATFQKASGVTFINNTLVGDGTNFSQDGVSFIGSNDYFVYSNRCSFITGNACYDNWGGSHDGTIALNEGDNSLYGVLINGLNTDRSVDTTYNITVAINKMYNMNQVGYWAGGLYDAGSGHYGVVRAINFIGNLVDGVTTFYGYQISDGVDNSLTGNTSINTAADGFRVGSENAGTTSHTKVESNTAVNANSTPLTFNGSLSAAVSGTLTASWTGSTGNAYVQFSTGGVQLASFTNGSAAVTWPTPVTATASAYVATGNYSGYYVNNLADHTQIIGNDVAGGLQAYDISVIAGVTANSIVSGMMQTGTSGYVADLSTTPTKMSIGTNGSIMLTAPGVICLGVSGFDCQATLDTGGNFFPASTTKNLGNNAFAWGQFWVIDPVARGSAPTGTGTCPINTQAGGNVGGTFKLNGACAAGTVIVTFTNAAPSGYVCPPATDQTTKAPFYQSASSTTTATFTGTGSSGDVIGFGPCFGY